MTQILSIDEAFNELMKGGWFSQLELDMQETVRNLSTLLQFKKGQHIYNVNEPGSGLFGLVQGTYDLLYPRDDGELVSVMRMNPGFWLGDLAAIAETPGLVTMVAMSDVSVVNVSARRLKKMLQANPKMNPEVYQISHQNMILALRTVAGLSLATSKAKVASRLVLIDDYLLESSSWWNISHNNMAQQLGLSSPTVQRTLKQFSDAGFIEVGYGRVRVLKRNKLLEHLH